MKKTARKLVLAKETVRRLGGSDLVQAAGGTGNCGSGNLGCQIYQVIKTIYGD